MCAEIGPRPDGKPKRRFLRASLLAGSAEWFDEFEMDARITRSDSEIGAGLGQYVALAFSDGVASDVGTDMEMLLAEVRRLTCCSATRGTLDGRRRGLELRQEQP